MPAKPSPSPEKLRSQFNDWIEGTELPGRTMSYLKTGFLDELLSARSEEDEVAPMLDAWSQWERAKLGPAEVLDVLKSNNIDGFLTNLLEG